MAQAAAPNRPSPPRQSTPKARIEVQKREPCVRDPAGRIADGAVGVSAQDRSSHVTHTAIGCRAAQDDQQHRSRDSASSGLHTNNNRPPVRPPRQSTPKAGIEVQKGSRACVIRQDEMRTCRGWICTGPVGSCHTYRHWVSSASRRPSATPLRLHAVRAAHQQRPPSDHHDTTGGRCAVSAAHLRP